MRCEANEYRKDKKCLVVFLLSATIAVAILIWGVVIFTHRNTNDEINENNETVNNSSLLNKRTPLNIKSLIELNPQLSVQQNNNKSNIQGFIIKDFMQHNGQTLWIELKTHSFIRLTKNQKIAV